MSLTPRQSVYSPQVASAGGSAPVGPSRSSDLRRTTEALPLGADEAFDPQVHVTISAIGQYLAKHGGDATNAESAIRSLLENLIVSGKYQRNENGTWRLLGQGYGVLLSADGGRIIGYSTVHHERTYAQVQTGVPSRSRRTGKNAEKRWVLRLQDDLPVRFTKLVLRRFARDVLGTEFTRATGREVVKAAYTRVMPVLPDRRPHDGARLRVTEPDGFKWHISYERDERPAIIHLCWRTGCGPAPASGTEVVR